MSTETVGPDVPEPAVPPQPDAAPAVPAQAPEPAAEALPAMTAADPEAAAGAFTDIPAELLAAGEEPKPGRKPSTGRLLLAAALLGPVIGTGVGYAIQASRPATPLPALQAVKLAYPAERVDAAALAAAAPKPLNIDGDLRDLLLKRPDGTEEWETRGVHGGWSDAADYAESYGNTKSVFTRMLSNGFRRAAIVTWKSGETKYRIRLIQYRSDSATSAINWDVNDSKDAEIGKIPGNPQSKTVIINSPVNYADSTEQFYYGDAYARKGDLVMEITIFSPGKVDRAQLEDIAKRQWERIA